MTYSELKQHVHEMVDQRAARSEALLQKGFELLAQARAEGFQKPLTLKQASRAFVRAQQGRRSDPASYVGLAYLFYLTRDFVQAESQLRMALKFAPQDPDARALLQHLQGHRLRPRDLLLELESLHRVQAHDYLALYQKVEQMIHAEVRRAMELSFPQPTASQDDFVLIQERAKYWGRVVRDLGRMLDILYVHLDTTALHQALLPLEQTKRRYAQLSQDCQALQELDERLLKTRIEVVQAYRDLQREQSLPRLRQHFQAQVMERLLDRCDAIADQLDAMSSRQIQTRRLEAEYHKLIAITESFREALEERLDQFRDSV